MTQRLRYPELAPAGIAAQSAVERYLNTGTDLPAVLLELVRLRASLLNGCEYCIGLHSAELRKHHEPESRVDAVAHWPDSDAFTQQERAALAWCDVMTNVQQTHASDDDFAAIRKHFTDVDVVNLTLAIASINAFNRLAIAFRPQWHEKPAPAADSSVVGDDGGKVTVDR